MAEIKVEITKDNSKQVLNDLNKATDNALTAIGIAAVSYAARITPVDTGLARNSITYALHGKPAAQQAYSDNSHGQSGAYKGNAEDKKNTVYIGSNVQYFPILEDGGNGRIGFHMLRKAVTEHSDEYKKLVEKYLKQEG